MDNAHTAAHHGHAEPSFSTKAIWRTFWILLVITCVELTVGMFIAPHFHNLKIMFNILYIFLTIIKAFYIVAEFMHLRHELKNLLMTIVVPLFLFFWFIGAFLWDGNSYKNLRNDYDPYKKEQATIKVSKPEHEPEAKKARRNRIVSERAVNIIYKLLNHRPSTMVFISGESIAIEKKF